MGVPDRHPAQLKAVYNAYQVYVCVLRDGDVVHTSAIYRDRPERARAPVFPDARLDAGGTLESETRAIMAGMRQWIVPAAA